MEDTPANYTDVNHRYGAALNEADKKQMAMLSEEEDGEDGDDAPQRRIKKRSKKKTVKNTTIEFLQPTDREKSMANAYGGQAIGSIRRPGIKYEEERLRGSKKFRVAAAEEHQIRAQFNQLVKSASGSQQIQKMGSSKEGSQSKGKRPQGFDEYPHEGGSENNVLQHRKADSSAKIDSRKNLGGGKTPHTTKGQNQDFEKMFGKDID